jgi:cytidylate kinase
MVVAIDIGVYTQFNRFYDSLIRDKNKVDSEEPINDFVYLIGGRTGSGKTTFANRISALLSNSGKNKVWKSTNFKQLLDNICIKSSECDVIIMDEAHNVLDSNLAPTKESKDCINLLKICRYRRLKILILTPDVFRLNSFVIEKRAVRLIEILRDRKFVVYAPSCFKKNYRIGYPTKNYYDRGYFIKLESESLKDMIETDKINKNQTLDLIYSKYNPNIGKMLSNNDKNNIKEGCGNQPTEISTN